MRNFEELREKYTLEDWFNILERNKPEKENHLHTLWIGLMLDTKQELDNEEERSHECDLLINDIISFLEKQQEEIFKKEV